MFSGVVPKPKVPTETWVANRNANEVWATAVSDPVNVQSPSPTVWIAPVAVPPRGPASSDPVKLPGGDPTPGALNAPLTTMEVRVAVVLLLASAGPGDPVPSPGARVWEARRTTGRRRAG